MGLEQYIRAGVALTRDIITFTASPSGSGSINLGSAYTLLSVGTNSPCRLRLYDTFDSLTNAGERARSFGNTSVSASTALVGDFSMSAAGTYTIDPPVYGVLENPTNKLTYYRTENTQSGVNPAITITRYLMEDSSISTLNRVNFPQITASLQANIIISGTLLSATNIPHTYLLVSASMIGSSTGSARLRLYTTNESFSNLTEISRSFTTESSNNSKLIVDAILTGSEVTYFVPKIAGANLQTMGTDLNVIRLDRAAILGNNELYYVLQNAVSSTATIRVTASLHVFSLED